MNQLHVCVPVVITRSDYNVFPCTFVYLQTRALIVQNEKVEAKDDDGDVYVTIKIQDNHISNFKHKWSEEDENGAFIEDGNDE